MKNTKNRTKSAHKKQQGKIRVPGREAQFPQEGEAVAGPEHRSGREEESQEYLETE